MQARNRFKRRHLPRWLAIAASLAITAAVVAQPRDRRPPREPNRDEAPAPAPDARSRPGGRGGPMHPGDGPPRDGPGGRADGRPDGRPGDQRPPPIRWDELPEPQRREIERFMEEHFPAVYLELQKLKDRNPQRYVRRMAVVAPQMHRMMDVIRTDPQRGALLIRERKTQMEMRLTVAQYHRATDEAQRRKLREKLEDLAAQAFDSQNQRREMEVRDLETRLSDLRARLQESQRLRPDLIRQRVDNLLERPPPNAPDSPFDEPPDGPDSPEP